MGPGVHTHKHAQTHTHRHIKNTHTHSHFDKGFARSHFVGFVSKQCFPDELVSEKAQLALLVLLVRWLIPECIQPCLKSGLCIDGRLMRMERKKKRIHKLDNGPYLGTKCTCEKAYVCVLVSTCLLVYAQEQDRKSVV